MVTVLLTTMLAASGSGVAPGVGVLDFAAQGGAATELAAALSTLTAQELERLSVFRVSSSETMRVMLGVERQRQLVGCENCNGTALADLASYDFIVTGKVLKTKTDYTLFLSLVPVGSSQALSSHKVTSLTEAALMQEVRPAVITLMAKVLEGRQGTLMITASEVGADVKIDERQVGTTPIDPVVIAAGPHLLTVEKDGFSPVRKEVRVTVDQITDVSVRLAPSPDTIVAYETRAKSLRALAWTTAGLAVVGFGVAVLSVAEGAHIYGDSTTEGSFQYARAHLLNNDESYRARANELKAQLTTWNTLAVVGMAVGAASAVASAVLFILGDDPGKYDQFHKVLQKGKATLALAPTLGGLVLFGTF